MQIIKSDITNETSGMIVHGTNCSGGFGSGCAGAIRRKWPQVYEAFQKQGTGEQLLGMIDIVKLTDDLFVCNAYTQIKAGYDGKRYADPLAIGIALHKAFSWSYLNGVELKTVQIGCGLGGLDWSTDVKPIIEKLEQQFETEIKIYTI